MGEPCLSRVTPPASSRPERQRRSWRVSSRGTERGASGGQRAARDVGHREARDGGRGSLRGVLRDDGGALGGDERDLVGDCLAVGLEHRRREVGDGERSGTIGSRIGARGDGDGARAAGGPGGGRRADPGGPAEQRVSGAQRLHGARGCGAPHDSEWIGHGSSTSRDDASRIFWMIIFGQSKV